MVPALLYIVAGVAMNSFIGTVPVWAWVVGFIVLNTIVNYAGIEITAKVNRIMLVAELIVLGIFLVVGVVALLQGKGNGPRCPRSTTPRPSRSARVLSAVSIAVLSFLGFDGISTLAEENTGDRRVVGRATLAALALAGTLFVVQTWVASMFVTDPAGLIANGDPSGRRSTTQPRSPAATGCRCSAPSPRRSPGVRQCARRAGGHLAPALLDGPRPATAAILARVHPTRRVPVNATLLVAAVSLVVGVWFAEREDGISLLSTLVNFGALTAFLLLHLAVINDFAVATAARAVGSTSGGTSSRRCWGSASSCSRSSRRTSPRSGSASPGWRSGSSW